MKMKRFTLLSAVALLIATATAYAAAPDVIVQAVETCCDLVLACCEASIGKDGRLFCVDSCAALDTCGARRHV